MPISAQKTCFFPKKSWVGEGEGKQIYSNDCLTILLYSFSLCQFCRNDKWFIYIHNVDMYGPIYFLHAGMLILVHVQVRVAGAFGEILVSL
jgi:hypothetical protein